MSQRHAVPGRQAVAEALRAGRPIDELRVAAAGADLEDLTAAAAEAGVPVRRVPAQQLDSLTKGVRHQGVVALCPPFAYVALERLAGAGLVIVLDGVTDPRNLGSIARVADQVGAGGLVVRARRAAGVTPAAERASAGALAWVPVAQVANISAALGVLTHTGMWSVALDGSGTDALWDAPLLDERVALVVGDEGAGVSRLVLERVDAVVRIPTSGRLGSLNASTAAAVAAFEWARRRYGR